METVLLRDRLHDAVLDELDISADLIDAGLPAFSRVRILGCAADFRLPVSDIDAADAQSHRRLLGGAIWSALLMTAGSGFVLALHNPAAGSFTIYGVTATCDVGVTAPLSAPFDDALAKAMVWDRNAVAELREWIPPPIADQPNAQLLNDIESVLGAGGKLELRQLGPLRTNVCSEWGTA